MRKINGGLITSKKQIFRFDIRFKNTIHILKKYSGTFLKITGRKRNFYFRKMPLNIGNLLESGISADKGVFRIME